MKTFIVTLVGGIKRTIRGFDHADVKATMYWEGISSTEIISIKKA